MKTYSKIDENYNVLLLIIDIVINFKTIPVFLIYKTNKVNIMLI